MIKNTDYSYIRPTIDVLDIVHERTLSIKKYYFIILYTLKWITLI